jgi:uncharacterized membrane protein YoaK (UPF0700 family)
MKLIRERRDLLIHLLMAFMGGASGMYGILIRGNFGQAVTSNLENVFRHLLIGDDLEDAFFRFGAILVFIMALSITHLLQYKSQRIAEIACFISQFICILISASLPESTSGIIALYPVFFMTGTQWATFTGAEGFKSATIFCTNNSKLAVFGWLDFLITGKHEYYKQGLFYTATIFCFYGAAVIFLFLCQDYREKAILFELIPLAIAGWTWFVNDR